MLGGGLTACDHNDLQLKVRDLRFWIESLRHTGAVSQKIVCSRVSRLDLRKSSDQGSMIMELAPRYDAGDMADTSCGLQRNRKAGKFHDEVFVLMNRFGPCHRLTGSRFHGLPILQLRSFVQMSLAEDLKSDT